MKKYYIGLDGGSTYLKAALIGNGRVIDTMVQKFHGYLLMQVHGMKD